MKAKEVIEKLYGAIEKYGDDCEVALLEGCCFGGDRYGIGVGLVASDDKTIQQYLQSEDSSLVKSKMDTIYTDYFGGTSPLW